MLKIYGSMLCKDCVQCREDLDKAGVSYEYLDFADDLKNLKEFLAIRESDPQFDEVRQKGGIGIPCIVTEEGKILLDWEALM
jgi:glutaredoxin-related protein